MIDTTRMNLTDEERFVVLAMRQSQQAGKAIYGYALKYDDPGNVDPRAPPWTHRR